MRDSISRRHFPLSAKELCGNILDGFGRRSLISGICQAAVRCLALPNATPNPKKGNPMRLRIRRALALSLALCSITLGMAAALADGWPQWMQNPQHTGFLNVVGQNLNQILANIVYDPLVPDEQAKNDGDLLAHYQVPLVEGNDVYMESKAGSYTVGSYATQTWH